MRAPAATALAFSALLAGSLPAGAASGTTCLCRSEDGKSFVDRTLRHGRWACDVRLGYLNEGGGKAKTPRPAGQTCNSEEIIQFRVWLCMESRCTYPYARGQSARNDGLKRIEPLKGERRP